MKKLVGLYNNYLVQMLARNFAILLHFHRVRHQKYQSGDCNLLIETLPVEIREDLQSCNRNGKGYVRLLLSSDHRMV